MKQHGESYPVLAATSLRNRPRLRVLLWIMALVLLSAVFMPPIMKGMTSDPIGNLNQGQVMNELMRELARDCQLLALLAAVPLLFRPGLRLLWFLSLLFAVARLLAVLFSWYAEKAWR